MMPRSTIVALVVLFAALGVLLWVAGGVGVSTKVFAPQPTLTATPTATPSPTPTLEPSAQAQRWTEGQPGALSYTADPSQQAQATYETITLDSFVEQMGIEPVPAEAKYPLVNALEQVKQVFEGQIQQGGYTVDPDAITGPDLKILADEAVALLRVKVPPQTTTNGQDFPGVDIAHLLIDKGDGNTLWVQYFLQGPENAAVYDDFLVWLSVNLPALLKPAETALTPSAETGATPAAEEATAEPTEAAPAAEEATAVPTEAAPAAEAPAAEATEVPAGPPAAEVQATPEATATRSAVETDFSDQWTETKPGSLVYATNENVTIQYGNVVLADFAQRLGVAPAAEGQPATIDDVLTQTRAGYDQMVETNSLTVEEGGLVGPATEDLNGVTVNYLYISLKAQTTATGQEVGGQQQYLGIIDLGEGEVQLIVFTNRSDPDPAIYAEFQTWLSDNAAVLAAPVAAPEPTPAP